MGWEGQKNQLAIWDVNERQVQMQLQKHVSKRLMYLWKTVGHLYHFQSCSCLLLLPEKANVLTLYSNSRLAAVHQTGTTELGVLHIKSTKINWDGILESATIYSMMCRSDNAARPQGEGPIWHSSGFIVRSGNKPQTSEVYCQCSATLGKLPSFQWSLTLICGRGIVKFNEVLHYPTVKDIEDCKVSLNSLSSSTSVFKWFNLNCTSAF